MRSFGVGVALIVLAAVFAPWLAPYDPNRPHFDALFAPASARYWLGADELGRDVLSRLLFAARASLWVGVAGVAVPLALGGTAGLIAGYLGGWIDTLLMRAMEVVAAFPAILLALALSATLGPGLETVVLAIATVNLPVFARLARAQTLILRELGFVEARRALGFGPFDIMFRTIGPGIAAPMLTQACLLVGASLLMESYLSFLGVGVQPPTPTWGHMLRDATSFLETAPGLAIFPGCALFLVVLAFNGLSDALGETLDPRDAFEDWEERME